MSTSVPPQQLFDLLPSVYRVRDATQGDPLRGLLTVIGEQFDLLEADIERLYDNWFIETCDEWVVPYIGDLLAVRGLVPVGEGVFSQRGLVANTIAYRRAKGTQSVIEKLARDVTGWPAKAVEFFELLATTRNLNHQPTRDVSTVEVRDARRAELVGGPFDGEAHTADIRHVDVGRGKFNIPNVGIYLWRLQDYYVGDTPVPDDPTTPPPPCGSTARDVMPLGGSAGRFTFSPLGDSAPLFNVPRTETTPTQLAAEANVPVALRRRPLHDELEALRQALVDNTQAPRVYFDDRQPVLRLIVIDALNGAPRLVPPEEIVICDLGTPGMAASEGWREPPDHKSYLPTGKDTPQDLRISAGVDPVSGRIAFPAGVHPFAVHVTYAYGFSADLGGGPYSRNETVADELPELADWRFATVSPAAGADPTLGIPPGTGGLVAVIPGAGGSRLLWQVGVAADAQPAEIAHRSTLGAAIDDWKAMPPGTLGVIVVMDSRTYHEDLSVNVPEDSKLAIVAADWPRDVEGTASLTPGRLAPTERRPHLRGHLEVTGTAPVNRSPGELVVDGLLIEGDLHVLGGNLGRLTLAHAAVVPGSGSVHVESQAPPETANGNLALALVRSVCGPIRIEAGASSDLLITGCIVDAGHDTAITARPARIEGSTIFGGVDVRSLSASNSIITGPVTVARRQTGCVRFCYLPLSSAAPRRFRCLPVPDNPDLAPAFTADSYGDPAYGQLAAACPGEIREGADDEGEIGAFGLLKQPKRIANLTTRLDEFLRFGLEAGVFFVT